MLVVSFFIPAEIVMGDENNRLLLLTASLSYVGISTNLANLHFRRQINSISLCRASASPKQLRSHRPPRFHHPQAAWDRRGSTIAALSGCVDEKLGSSHPATGGDDEAHFRGEYRLLDRHKPHNIPRDSAGIRVLSVSDIRRGAEHIIVSEGKIWYSCRAV